MTRRRMGLMAAVVAMLTISAFGDVTKLISDTKDKVGALARFYCTMQDEMGVRTLEGQAVCITADPAVFITLGLNARVPPGSFNNFVLVPANAPDKTIKAELLGVDPETNIAFLRATEPYAWGVVQFAPKAGLTVGQPVASIGLLGREMNYQPYVGVGYVSAILGLPDNLDYVTGGKLTVPGSPVFNADGRAVGLVGSQQFLDYQMAMGSRMTTLSMRGQDETAFFMPVDEFAHVLVNIPASPAQVRRLPWIGVLNFSGISKEVADIMKLQGAGVMVEGVIPDGPAAKAGLADRDVILAVNGEKFPVAANPDTAALALQRKLYRMTIGSKVTLTVKRGDTTKDYEVSLAALPQLPYEAKRYLNMAMGFLVREKIDLDRYMDKSLAANVPGLLVLAADGPAASAGLHEGDLITTVNNTPVTTTAGLKDAVEASAKGGKPVVIVVRRGEQTQTITIQPQATQPTGGK
ncbi:MAG: PDZ domain-containing protein [Phycisphaerae bacterium]